LKRLVKLTAFILLSSNASATPATPDMNAINHAAEAFYEYEGWNKIVNDTLKDYEKMFTEEQKKYGSYAYWIANAIFRQKVEVVYHFP
jgi:uncharacterized protein YhaN